VNALKRRRLERERSDVQEAIDRLQAAAGTDSTREFADLWARKIELLRRLEVLNG
jgi:hypothetical protein